MKIIIEPYSGGKYTAEHEAEHISEVVTAFKGLLVASGYHPSTVDEYFNEVDEWFPEEDSNKYVNQVALHKKITDNI